MADTYTILLPVISLVTIAPNPALTNAVLSIAATITEIEKILEPVFYYAGEIYAGEVW